MQRESATYEGEGNREGGSILACLMAGYEKILAAQGKIGGETGIRTLGRASPSLVFETSPSTPSTLDVSSNCDESKTPLSCRLTLSHDNPIVGEVNPLPPDLAEIVLSWLSIPDPIKAAVKAVLAPYMKMEGKE